MKGKILVPLTIVLLLVAATACTQAETQPPEFNSGGALPVQPPQTAQPAQPNTRVVKIADILTQPERFTEGKVMIEGKIISECPAGCWFTINDGTGTIYVDLTPSNLTIPQKRGSFARVYGRVAKKGGDTYIIGEKVEF